MVGSSPREVPPSHTTHAPSLSPPVFLLCYRMIRLEVMLGLALFSGAEFDNIRNVISLFHQSVKPKRSQSSRTL
jgi:hypothetical protein